MASPDLSALKIHRDEEDPVRPRRGWRRALLWIGALAVISVSWWIAWRSDWLPRGAAEVRVARPRVIQPGGAEEVLTATGYIVPQLRSVVSARTSGRLEWLGVGEGSRVKAGEVIARLDNDDLAAQVREARASLAQAKANLAQARATQWQAEREVERQRNLSAQGITTASDFDDAVRAHDVARAGEASAQEAVNVAQARLSLTQANYDKTIVTAPFDGVVIKKSSEIGEMVAAGAFSGQPTGGAIVTIADFSTLQMEADINESNLSKVQVGQHAAVAVDAVPNHRYRGVLERIVPAADRQKAVVLAKVKILDLDDRLVPDMSARVSFLTREAADSLSDPPRIFIPASTIRVEGSQTFVLAVRDERVVRISVGLGESRGDLREVTSGLTGQETLIDGDAGGAGAGDRVRVAS